MVIYRRENVFKPQNGVMKLIKHSIFNDVLGPIMAGPSSSHSAGCARIGRMTRLLWGKEIKKAVVVYDSKGSYPSTCVGQGSNFGFTGGLLGFHNDDPRMKDSQKIAKEQEVDISFEEEVLSQRHPNEARIDIYDEDGEVGLSVLTFSTGGGMFEIVEMDGFPVFMDGSKEQIYVCCYPWAARKFYDRLEKVAKKITVPAPRGTVLAFCNTMICAEDFTIDSREINDLVEELKKEKGVAYVRRGEVVLPVPMRPENEPVFSTAEEAKVYFEDILEKTGDKKEMWELAADYECSLGYVTPEEVWQQAEHTLDIMKAATAPPDPDITEMFGFLPYQATAMQKKKKKIKTVNTGYLDKAMMYALAVMENSCAHNIVVAAPTAGSSGVIPAEILAIGEEMGCSKDEMIKGLLAAGLVGAFIANQASFGAEVAACQAENGSASAMAAAGVVQLLGGDVEQGFKAASLAFQNMLGLVCDPVGGLTEIPCISRNVSAMSNAVQSANMVMLGFDPVIPLDETILSMYEVGQMLPSELRCTCKGGLCNTKTAKHVVERLHRSK